MSVQGMKFAETSLAERVTAVRAEIVRACERAGRSPDEVTLIAVSKMHAPPLIAEAIRAGIRDLGENRPEDAAPKLQAVAALVAEPVRWHMIGHVQSRKARLVTRGYSLLHSLDSVRLAERLARNLAAHGNTLDVLLQMNVSGEATKEGFDAYQWNKRTTQRADLWRDIAAILALPGLRVRGLMTIAPLADDPEAARSTFAALRGLRDALREDFPGAEWSALSMGMTDDYPIAIEEGATLVRIGRAIFGARRTG